MQNMLGKIITEKVYCGLDIGSQKIKAAVMRVKENKEVELLGAYENKTQGFKGLSVTDLNELSECINQILTELSKRLNIKIKDVELGVGAELVESRETQAVVPLADRASKIITQGDIKRVNHQARLLGLKMEEEILHELPQHYLVDDVNTALNPLGLYGTKLAVQSMLIVSNINRVRNIVHAVNHAGYDVSHLHLSPYASAEVVVSEQERNEGVVLVDIGSKATSILVYKDGVLKSLGKVILGGDNFTTAIASQLNLTFDLAEEIKKSYAGALSQDDQLKEEILVKREQNFIPIKREIIYQSIESEVIHLIEGLKNYLQPNWVGKINRGIVIVGGASLLTGLIERIGQDLNMPAKLGKLNIPIQKNLCNSANFSSAVGLAYSGFKHSFKFAQPLEQPMQWHKRLANRIKELYEEYF
jgi:cell division protein FtsA